MPLPWQVLSTILNGLLKPVVERITEGIDSCLFKHRRNISQFEIDIVYCTTVYLVIRVLFFKRFQFELRKRLIRWDFIDSGAYIIFIYVITRCPDTA